MFLPEKVFVVFGSASDSPVFNGIRQKLSEKGVSCKVNVLSAHRTPKELERALRKTKAKLFVAGAGLSAALPGVVASQTIKPVFGIACAGAFDGLDSFLATVQMPPGVPVLAVNLSEEKEIARHAENYFSSFEKIVVVENPETDLSLIRKAEEVFEKLGVKYEKSGSPVSFHKKNIYLVFCPLEKLSTLPFTDATLVVVPTKPKTSKEDALVFFGNAKRHLFVGVNRAENAALGAVQLLNFSGKFDKKIIAYRKEQAKKVIGSNKAIEN